MRDLSAKQKRILKRLAKNPHSAADMNEQDVDELRIEGLVYTAIDEGRLQTANLTPVAREALEKASKK